MDPTIGIPGPAEGSTELGVALGLPQEFLEGVLAAQRGLQAASPVLVQTEHLDSIVEFIAARGAVRVKLICGAAATGKSTLLAHVARAVVEDQTMETVLRFASDVLGSAGSNIPRLPAGPCVLVVDDAHQKHCADSLLRLANEREDVRFVFACRPGGLSRLLASCSQAGLSPNEYSVMPLQPGRMQAQAVKDSYDALLTRTSSGADQKIIVGLLGLLAMLAPVRVADERFLAAAGELLGCRRRDLVSALRAFDQANVMERAALGARIVPSALADHALLEVLTADWPLSGSLSARARVVTRHFGVHTLVPLLRNVKELDGPSVSEGIAAEFFRELFEHCRGELETSAVFDRCRLLSALREIAVDEPAAMLELVEVALHLRPTGDAPEPSQVFLSETNVVNELPAILQRVALHARHVPKAMDLLWNLGRDDVRLQSPHPDHPMRVLRDFAARGHSRPLGLHESLLDAVDRWLAEPDAHFHKHSPIDVLDTFLAESDSEDEDGAWVTRMIGLRSQAMQALARTACSSNRRAALSGVSGLESVLTNASISSSIGFPEPLWRNGERLQVLEMLRRVVTSTADPFVHFAVADVFRWTAHRTTIDAIRAFAEDALADVPESSERRLYEALTQRPPPHRGITDAEVPPSSVLLGDQKSNEPRGANVSRIVVADWIAYRLSAESIVDQIADALDALSDAGKSGSPRRLLQVFALRNPDVAAAACEQIILCPTGRLGPHVAALLHTLRESAPKRATELLTDIVQGGDATLCASLAQAFPRWVDKPRHGDLETLQRILVHPDGFVRRAALGALRTLAKAGSRDAITLALQVDLSESSEAAETLFAALDAGRLLKGDFLSTEEIRTLLLRVAEAPTLDGHSTMRFLHLCGKQLPNETATMLLDRIERLIGGELALVQDFAPLPAEGLSTILAHLPESPDWIAVLRRTRDLARSRSHGVRVQATRLFQAASKNYAPQAIEVLSEWAHEAGPEELETVCVLLEEAPSTIFFTHVHFIATLLRRSHEMGGALFDTVQNSLRPIALGQKRHRAMGAQPDEKRLRALAREAAAKLPPRSPEQRFFDSIVKHTESMIAEENDLDHDDLFEL